MKKLTPLKAIKQFCIDCGDGTRKEVKLCPIHDCPLFIYRFGKKPVSQGALMEIGSESGTLS
jgi:hypothetical protein